MIDAVADMNGLAHNDDPALTGAFGDRRDAGQTSQCMIISALQGIGCFCEQRGEDDPSDARQGSQDRHVALLILLPRVSIFISGELACEMVDPGIRAGNLAIDEIEAQGNRFEVSGRCVDRPRGNRNGGNLQLFQYLAGGDPPDSIAFQQFGDGGFADAL